MHRERRIGAGKRMTALVGEEEEKDKEFWGDGNAIWDEDDSEFTEEDSEPDVFDSDFNDTESEEDEGENSEEERKIKARERRAKAQKKAQKGYKEPVTNSSGKVGGTDRNDPSKKANEINQQLSSTTKYLQDKNRAKMARLGLLDIGLKDNKQDKNRKSTRLVDVQFSSMGRSASRGSDRIRSGKSETGSMKSATTLNTKKGGGSSKAPTPKTQQSQTIYTQEEILIEATSTELENEKWLLSRKRQMEESALLESKKAGGGKKGLMTKEDMEGPKPTTRNRETKIRTRFISKRGCPMTITFPDIDLMPDFLKDTGKNNDEFDDLDFDVDAGGWERFADEGENDINIDQEDNRNKDDERIFNEDDMEERRRKKKTESMSSSIVEFDYGRGKVSIDRECDLEASFDYIDLRKPASIFESRQNNPNIPLCPIYGVPAKYKDPLTNQYYSNIAAFQEIRRRANLPHTTRASGTLATC